MKRRITATALVLLLLTQVLAVCSCVNGGTGDITTAEGTASVPETRADIVVGGVTEYVVVRPDECSDEIIALALKVQNSIESYTGAKPGIRTDFNMPKDTPENTKYEILVGRTNREETETALTGLRSRDYVVGVYGTKLVIAGTTEAAIDRAVSAFISSFLVPQSTSGGNLTVKSGENIVKLYEDYRIKSSSVLGVGIDLFSIVYSKSDEYAAERTARMLALSLENASGYEIPVDDDKGTADSGDKYEIVIGMTKHGGEAVSERHGYTVRASGKKLYVGAECLFGYLAAYNYLTKTLFYGGDIKIEDGYTYSAAADIEKLTGNTLINAKTGGYRVIFNNILGNCDTSIYPTPTRNLMIAALHAEYAPDVLGLQECSPNSRGNSSYIAAMSALGYTEVKVTATNAGGVNYTPLLYRADRLDVIESGYHLYNDGAGDKSKSITWAVFADKTTAARFAVCSTHFYYTGDAKGEAARLLDAEQLTSVADSIVKKYGCAVIAGGDLNCNVSSNPYKKLKEGGFTGIQAASAVTDNIKTHHAYPEYNSDRKYYDTMTFPSGDYSGAIDHALLYNGAGVTLKTFDVITDDYALLSTDHCPILVDFDINK